MLNQSTFHMYHLPVIIFNKLLIFNSVCFSYFYLYCFPQCQIFLWAPSNFTSIYKDFISMSSEFYKLTFHILLLPFFPYPEYLSSSLSIYVSALSSSFTYMIWNFLIFGQNFYLFSSSIFWVHSHFCCFPLYFPCCHFLPLMLYQLLLIISYPRNL